MAQLGFQYGPWQAPQGYSGKLDLSEFRDMANWAQGHREEAGAQQALGGFADSLGGLDPDGHGPQTAPPSLTQFGLPPAEQMRAMLMNPQTRQAGLQLYRDAQSRMEQANDPLRKLQIEQAQLNLHQARNPAGPAPTADMRNFEFAQQNPGFAEFINGSGAGDAPAAVQEYLWYRKNETEAGREPLGFLEFGAAKRGPGLSVQTNPDGTTTVTQGGSGGRLTEMQGKDLGFFVRGTEANNNLATLESELTNLVQARADILPLGLGNYLRTPEFRQAKVAADNFLAVILRKDTGAAVTPHEFNLYGPMFLPVPADDPGTIAMKRRMRNVAVTAIGEGLGTAEAIGKATLEQLNIAETPTGPTTPQAPSAGATEAVPPAPAGVDPAEWQELWAVMKPEERAAFN